VEQELLPLSLHGMILLFTKEERKERMIAPPAKTGNKRK
jgi:hypothetical protein